MDAESLSLAQQNYIETIDALTESHGFASITALAASLKISKPSVTETISRLEKSGLVIRKSRHQIVLSDTGSEINSQLTRKHVGLRRFMVDVMAMDGAEADTLACKVEHCVDRQFSERLVKLATLLETSHPKILSKICKDMRRDDGEAEPKRVMKACPIRTRK
jgi:DtxR family Mn-dependent transcriptional regulator